MGEFKNHLRLPGCGSICACVCQCQPRGSESLIRKKLTERRLRMICQEKEKLLQNQLLELNLYRKITKDNNIKANSWGVRIKIINKIIKMKNTQNLHKAEQQARLVNIVKKLVNEHEWREKIKIKKIPEIKPIKISKKQEKEFEETYQDIESTQADEVPTLEEFQEVIEKGSSFSKVTKKGKKEKSGGKVIMEGEDTEDTEQKNGKKSKKDKKEKKDKKDKKDKDKKKLKDKEEKGSPKEKKGKGKKEKVEKEPQIFTLPEIPIINPRLKVTPTDMEEAIHEHFKYSEILGNKLKEYKNCEKREPFEQEYLCKLKVDIPPEIIEFIKVENEKLAVRDLDITDL